MCTSLSRFVIERQLGRGQAGHVCTARDLLLGTSVALKLFLSDDRDDALDEVKVVNRIASHDTGFVPTFYGTHLFDNGMVGICMSVVDGLPIRQAPVQNARRFAASLFSALTFLHSRDVAHRDINPTNVMVKRDGTACLIDFNWATTKEDCTTAPVTSVNYNSPEYLFYNMATDLWRVTTMNDVWGATVLLLTKFINRPFPWMTGERAKVEQHWMSSNMAPHVQIMNFVAGSKHQSTSWLISLASAGTAPIQNRYTAALMKIV
jgi:serine/threonine protein kinase